MFENQLPNLPDLLRKYTQEDMLASSVRASLSLVGPVGVITGEFLTQFVPGQRMDRLQDFVEILAERLSGLEEQFKQRLSTSAGFAALTEKTTLSAVRTASTEHRRDLAALLHHGLHRVEADMLEEAALLSLRDRVNDAQVLILMSYGNFKRTFGEADLNAFFDAHPGLFSVHPPTQDSSDDERRRWTFREHYEGELESLGLLRDTEGVAKSGRQRKYAITNLGRLLLQCIGRYDPRHPNRGSV